MNSTELIKRFIDRYGEEAILDEINSADITTYAERNDLITEKELDDFSDYEIIEKAKELDCRIVSECYLNVFTDDTLWWDECLKELAALKSSDKITLDKIKAMWNE